MEKAKKMSFVDRLTVVIEEKLAPPLISLSHIRYLDALQKSFMILMPYMILGAMVTLVLNLGGLFDEGTGLGLPGVAAAINGIIAPLRPWLTQIIFVTIDLLAFIVAVLNGYFLAEYYHQKDSNVSPVAGAVVAMVSFLCFVDISAISANWDWPAYILGSPSLFGAILISIASVEIYRMLVGKKITIKMPESVPPMVADAFTALLPVCINVLFFALIGRGIAGVDLLGMINHVFSYLVIGGSGPIPQFFGFLLDRVLWFVGIHGSNVVSSIMQPIWNTMITDNIAAFSNGQAIPYMFTEQWCNYYVRVSVFPIALMCAMSSCKRFKTLGKLSLPGTVFNIAEPVMYGLPIVLNPLMFVPWVIGFPVLFLLQVLVAAVGITPPVVAMTVWTMPVPLGAFIGSGFKVSALVISILSMVILYFIFLPFFKIYEKQELEAEKMNEQLMANQDGK